ncbi:hypothetical protein [uncultured Microbacterium sp.]|uniref:hypothetical protein n=1 Tax=uncultured Microbacterium sp. TaxID=191216 RepID=UPI0025DB63CB|nr:hypothetical protein [uncultured Microbacterium sp.]
MNSKQQIKINRAEAEYAEAVAQAQAVPSGYTRRQVKKADRARKLAALPMWKRVVPSVVIVGLFVIVVASCTANGQADRAEVERCIAAQESALADAGSERALTTEEVAACNDPAKRAWILGEQ